MEDLLQKILVGDSSINVEFLKNKTREITAEGYLMYISEIVNGVQQTGAGVLLIVNNHFF